MLAGLLGLVKANWPEVGPSEKVAAGSIAQPTRVLTSAAWATGASSDPTRAVLRMVRRNGVGARLFMRILVVCRGLSWSVVVRGGPTCSPISFFWCALTLA